MQNTSDNMPECEVCREAPTHILVDYHQYVLDGGKFYCAEHAFNDKRQECHLCDDYEIEHHNVKYLPAYAPGSLNDGCCSEHP